MHLPALEYFTARLLLLAPLSIDPELRTHELGVLHRLAQQSRERAAIKLRTGDPAAEPEI